MLVRPTHPLYHPVTVRVSGPARKGIALLNIPLPRTRDEIDAARQARVLPAMQNAWRSPFFRRKLREAGIEEGDSPSDEKWRAIAPTTKEEIRTLSTDEFFEQLVIAPSTEIGMYWRSGGATGRPLFYPRARIDLPACVDSVVRALQLAGLQEGDLVHNSFPYMGLHPIGHLFGHALSNLGCGNIFAGAGANTPSDVQAGLIFDLMPTAWTGIGSYIIHLGHRAEALGFDPSSSAVRRIVSSAEPLTPAKRRRIQDVWGAELFDVYGMTECSLLGGECGNHDGIHAWTDLFLVEILDEDTWEPLPPGELGMVVVTPLHNSAALPFVRWASGDLGVFYPDCTCAGPYAVFPRVKLAARTLGFSKIRGVNVNHNDMEDLLISLPVVADYSVSVVTVDFRDVLRIEVEAAGDVSAEDLVRILVSDVSNRFELQPEVEILDRGAIARRLEGEVKQVRFRDLRGEHDA
jgi:phenylacetate-CoA ligase